MLKLFNRLAWGLSWSLGFFIVFLLGIFTNIIDDFNAFNGEAFFVWFILIWIAALIVKGTFFSRAYIVKMFDKQGNEAKEFIGKEKNLVKEKLISDMEPLSAGLAKLAGGSKSEIKSEKITGNIFSDKKIIEKKNSEDSHHSISTHEEDKNIFETTAKKDTGPNIIQAFFKENALAKIGGILLFLAVVFLLQLVYVRIGPIGKLMIGFAFGFIIFTIGLMLDHKGHQKEAKILFGVSILINYLVILSGRYLIGEVLFVKQTILNESITFFLLIVNTIFAISVAMAHESKALLFFSFVMAYINPFLLGEKISLTVYAMLAYSLLISLGGVFLSIYYKRRSEALTESFLNISFIGGNILILFAPFDNVWQWILKLAVLVLLSIVCIYYSYKNKNNKIVPLYFMGAYVFFALLAAGGSFDLNLAFKGLASTLSILSFFVIMVLGNAFFFFRFAINSLFYLLFAPLLIILALFEMHIFDINSLIYIIVGSMLVYLIIFSSALEKINEKMSYIFFSALALFVFFISVIWKAEPIINNSTTSSIQDFGIIVSIFMFLFSAYYFSRKKGLEQLYALSSLASVFILATVIERTGNLRLISIISIVLFMVLNILWPLANKQLMYRNTSNLVFGMVVGAIFAVTEFFYFWYGSASQSTMHLGISFVFLAIIYFFVSCAMYQILNHHNQALASNDKKVSIGDTVYSIIGISISIFSLAIVYIFSKHSEIVSVILLFESSLLFYFYTRKQSIKIYLAGLILMFVGLAHLSRLIDLVNVREYIMFLPLLVVFLSFVLSLKFLSFEKRNLRIIHDLGHAIGIAIMAAILFEIIPDHGYGWLVLASSIYALILAIVYSTIFAGKIKEMFIFALAVLFFNQIFNLEFLFYRLDGAHLGGLKIIQHISTVIFFLSVLAFNFMPRLINLKTVIKDNATFWLNGIFSLYAFVITTQYVYFFFDKSEFIITIYWGILSLVFLFYGIQKNIIRLRTLGLYILSLTVLKILFLDIWSGLDDAIMRVIALIVVGGIMISVSVLYGKKYEGDLKEEFNFENLLNNEN